MELEWLKKNQRLMASHELRKPIDHEHTSLSVRRQCELLALPKSTLYSKPEPVAPQRLLVMTRIDAWYLEDPAAGNRRMVDYLDGAGFNVAVCDTSCSAWVYRLPGVNYLGERFASTNCNQERL